MKGSLWKKIVLGVVSCFWLYVFLKNLFAYTPNTFWATSAGTLLQSLLVILLTYLLTNRNADDRKKLDSLHNVIILIQNTLVKHDELVGNYLNALQEKNTSQPAVTKQLYQKILLSKRNINNYIDILSYYPTTTEFKTCVDEIKTQFTSYSDLLETECPLSQEEISPYIRVELEKSFTLASQKTVLLQTLIYYKVKSKS